MMLKSNQKFTEAHFDQDLALTNAKIRVGPTRACTTKSVQMIARPPRQVTAPFNYTIMDSEDYSYGASTLFPEQLKSAHDIDREDVMKRVSRSITKGKMKSKRIG